MQRFHLSLAVLLVLASAPAVCADDAERTAAATLDLERFYRDVRAAVRRHYPGATAHHLENKIHFEYRTRIFIVHVASKTGEWQDPWEERGPRKDGVYCDIEFRKGAYRGAAMVPQTLDRRYFRVLLLAPYSERLDGHLYVHLKLPSLGTVPAGFQKEITALINGFEAYAKPM